MRDAFLLKSKKTSILSKPAFFLLLCSVILTGILAVAAVQHIHRGMRLMELSFLRQGTTMISAFEAGARTSMLFRQSVGHNPLVDLATEILRDTGIAYIRIIDDKDRVLVSEGVMPSAMAKSSTTMTDIGSDPVSVINWDARIFEVTKEFMPIRTAPKSMMEMRWEQWHIEHQSPGKMFISVGFYTNEFEAARKEDMRHTLFMAAMLFLLFAAGLYFLFLYKNLRLTHNTLLNTRLYADHVLESIPDSLITLDADNRIASCNGKTARLFGRRIEELEGRPIVEAWPECPVDLLQENEKPVELSAECRHVSGELVPMKTRSAWLLDHLGQRIGRVLVMRDIREIRKMEVQLERSRRLAALGSMAAGIAHEVRNPLGTLRGFAQFFGAEAGASEA